jgi:hypothetical protein
MLLQLLLYYGVLQPIRNLLRFLKIDSEVFRSRTLGEPFDGAQPIVDCSPSSPTHSTMMFQRMFSSWLVSGASEP